MVFWLERNDEEIIDWKQSINVQYQSLRMYIFARYTYAVITCE